MARLECEFENLKQIAADKDKIKFFFLMNDWFYFTELHAHIFFYKLKYVNKVCYSKAT